MDCTVQTRRQTFTLIFRFRIGLRPDHAGKLTNQIKANQVKSNVDLYSTLSKNI